MTTDIAFFFADCVYGFRPSPLTRLGRNDGMRYRIAPQR